VIKELSEALRSLINSLSTKPLATLTSIFIIFAAYLGYKSYDVIQSLVITPDMEAERFEKQLTSAEITNEAIEALRIELSAENVIIRQFHNGKHDLTGIPFTSIATTFYVDASDIDPIDEPVSSSNRSLRKVWQRIDKPECVILNEPVDISTRVYFKSHKLRKAAICPLVNLLNYPIGVMVVGFSEGNTISDAVILDKTSAISKRVTGYLTDASTTRN
jgi:hypothetical protein